jgi:LacI family transcriptional regulator
MATMKDVAHRAGVSTATVSRALSGVADAVRPATRERVLQAVAELAYHPNHLPRNMRQRSSRTLGLVITDIANPFFTAIVRGCEDVAQSQGYSFLLANTDEDAAKEEQTLRTMASERVAGVILASADEASEPIRRLLGSRIPVVALDRRIDGVAVDTVTSDNDSGAYDATKHLLDLGHERIGLVAGPETISSMRERTAGYTRALRSHGITETLVSAGDLRERSGYTATLQLLDLPEPPTAIFSANNLMTIGVLAALRERGLSVPDEISLIGFDDLPTAELLQPPLTVVAQPTYQLGARAAELLLQRVRNPDAPVQEIVLAPQLVLRASTGPLRG